MPKTVSTAARDQTFDQTDADSGHAAFPRMAGRMGGDAVGAFYDAVIGLGQRKPQPARQPRAEAFAGHHRDLLLIQQGSGEGLARKAGCTDVDQDKHPRLGPVDPQAADAIQRLRDDVGAAGKAFGHASGNGRRFGNCKFGHVSNEWLRAKKHGF
jgi:hypothetical protein